MRDEERELVYTQVLQKLVDELRNALESLLPEIGSDVSSSSYSGVAWERFTRLL